MKSWSILTVIAVHCVALPTAAPIAYAGLSVQEIQQTTDPAGDSSFADQIVDATGGIVIHKFQGRRTKLTLYDPASPDGWGGIVAKDLSGADAFASVNVGDWISFAGVLVEEFWGNTQLTFDAGSNTFTVESTGNALPRALYVDVLDLANPNAGVGEQYEAMYVGFEDVLVGALDLGKAGDNYELIDLLGNVAWGADYMNVDAEGPYHSSIHTGVKLSRFSGIVEQYTDPDAGWDYYQIVTARDADVVPELATILLVLAGGLVVRGRAGFARSQRRL